MGIEVDPVKLKIQGDLSALQASLALVIPDLRTFGGLLDAAAASAKMLKDAGVLTASTLKTVKAASEAATEAVNSGVKASERAAKTQADVAKQAILAQRAGNAVLEVYKLEGTALTNLDRISGQYASILKETGKEKSFLNTMWRQGLSPAEKTAVRLAELVSKTTLAERGTKAYAAAVMELTKRYADQYRRQEENVDGNFKLSRSLSHLMDQQRGAITASAVFQTTLQTKMLEALRKTDSGLGAAASRFVTFGDNGKFALTSLGASATLVVASIAGVVAAIAALGFGMVKAALHSAAFTQTLAGIGAVTEATTAELKMLHDAAIQAGIATQFSPKESADGLQELATAGLNAKDSTVALIPVLDLAAGSLGQIGVAGAATAVVGTLNAYQMGVNKATEVTDKLLKATQKTNLQARDFEVALSTASGTAGTFGQSLESTLTILGALRNRNIESSVAATAYRESVRRLAAETDAQGAVLEQNVDIYDRTTGKMRELDQIILDFAEKTKDLTEAERNRAVVTAFGARGIQAFAAVAGMGRDAVDQLKASLQNADGTAASFRDKTLNTLQGQITLLKGSLDTLVTVIGERFEPALKLIVSLGTSALNVMIALFNGGADAPKAAEQLEAVKKKAEEVAAKLRGLDMSTAIGRQSLAPLTTQYQMLQDRIKELEAQIKKSGAAEKGINEEAAAALENRRKGVLDFIATGLTPLEKATVDYKNAVRQARDALSEHAITEEEYDKAVQLAKRNLDAAKEAERERTKAMRDAAKTAEKAAAADKAYSEFVAQSARMTKEFITTAPGIQSVAVAFHGVKERAKEATTQIESLASLAGLRDVSDQVREIESTLNRMGSAEIFGGLLTQRLAQGIAKAADMAKSAFKGISAAGGLAMGGINAIMQAATGQDLFSFITENGANAGKVLTDALANIDFAALLKGLAQGLVGVLTALGSDGSLIKGIFEALAGAMTYLANNADVIVDLVLNILMAIVDNIDVLAVAFVQLGIQLAIGLVKALPQIAFALLEAIANLLRGVIVGILKALGLDSLAESLMGTTGGGGGTGSTTTAAQSETTPTSMNQARGQEMAVTDAHYRAVSGRRSLSLTPGDVAEVYRSGALGQSSRRDPVAERQMEEQNQLLRELIEQNAALRSDLLRGRHREAAGGRQGRK